MKKSLRNKLLTEYPEWHQYPLRLTLKEINNPLDVISSFFETYNLPAIRACLKDWLDDSLTSVTLQAKDHVTTYNDIERLIEAISIMYKKKIKKKMED